MGLHFGDIFLLPLSKKRRQIPHQIEVSIEKDLHRVSCGYNIVGRQMVYFVVEYQFCGICMAIDNLYPCTVFVS